MTPRKETGPLLITKTKKVLLTLAREVILSHLMITRTQQEQFTAKETENFNHSNLLSVEVQSAFL